MKCWASWRYSKGYFPKAGGCSREWLSVAMRAGAILKAEKLFECEENVMRIRARGDGRRMRILAAAAPTRA